MIAGYFLRGAFSEREFGKRFAEGMAFLQSE